MKSYKMRIGKKACCAATNPFRRLAPRSGLEHNFLLRVSAYVEIMWPETPDRGSLMRWVRRLFQKSRTEEHLDKELRFHLEQRIADYVAAGLSADEARRRAHLEFGGLERVKEEVRDTRWETSLDNLLRDFRYAFRSLRRDHSFSL